MQYRGLLLTFLALSAWLLASCTTTPPSDDIDLSKEVLSEEAINARVKHLVDQARESQPPEREVYLLEATELLISQGEFDWARNLLTSINSRHLENGDFLTYTELLGEVSLAEGAYFLAQRILTNPRLEQQWAQMEPEQEVKLRRLRARSFALLGDVDASVRERITLGTVLSDSEAEAANRELLWQTLMSLPRSQLERDAESAEEEQLRGWLELAALSKNNQANLERQQAEVDEWRQQWPNHPASQYPPNDLQLLKTLIDEQPRQIALLLPQQGNLARSAEAVRDGFLAAYYLAVEEQNQAPQIRQYDTSTDRHIVDIYNEALTEGADLVIGPLDRDQVQQLYNEDDLPIPVLTLNYTDVTIEGDDREGPRNLYQFGLAAEDEARQVARRAFQEGHRQAMILAPQRGWTTRSARAFTREWEELGGEIAFDSQFSSTGDYSRMIQQALLIDQSQARRQELQRSLGSVLEFEPRRRQDLDMIFLMTEPEQGRQVRPTLSFHYAGDLPVYATSHIYNGRPNPSSNRDLNGIRFNTLPWLLEGEFPEKDLLEQHTQSSAIYSRLHALGVDAYRLYPRLPQLEQMEQARLYGATGTLRVRPGGRLERELDWAQFKGGQAQPITATTSADEAVEDLTNGLPTPR